MRRLASALAALALLAGVAHGETGEIRVSLRGVVRPGAPSLVTVTVPAAGTVDLVLTDETGEQVSVIALEFIDRDKR